MTDTPSLLTRAFLALLFIVPAVLIAREIVVARRDPAAYWTKARIIVWAAIVPLILYLRGPLFVQTLMPPKTVLVDFFQEWSSVQNWQRGLPIYETQDLAATRYLGLNIDIQEFNAIEINAHPPVSVLIAMPVAWMPYPLATLAWNLLSLLLGGAAIWVLNRELRLAQTWRPLLAFVPLALCFDPLIEQTFYGQFNLLLLFLIVGTWAAARRGQDLLAGVFLGTAVVVKLFPGMLLLYYALQRRWRLLAAAVLTAAAWSGIALLIFGLQAHKDYVFKVLPHVHEWRAAWWNLSLLGWWSRLFDPGTKGGPVLALMQAPWLVRVGTYACIFALTIVASCLAWRARTAAQCELSFALFIVTMLLASPTCWPHYLLLLLLPAAQLWSMVNNGRLLALGLAILPLPFWVPPGTCCLIYGKLVWPVMPRASLLLLSAKTYALLAFWFFIAYVAVAKRYLGSAGRTRKQHTSPASSQAPEVLPNGTLAS